MGTYKKYSSVPKYQIMYETGLLYGTLEPESMKRVHSAFMKWLSSVRQKNAKMYYPSTDGMADYEATILHQMAENAIDGMVAFWGHCADDDDTIPTGSPFPNNSGGGLGQPPDSSEGGHINTYQPTNISTYSNIDGFDEFWNAYPKKRNVMKQEKNFRNRILM